MDTRLAEIKKPIRVVDYDPAWPLAFQSLKTEIEQRLGTLVDSIHHVGSTSVPGLAAKPKIDVDAVIRSAADLPQSIALIRVDTSWTFHGDPYGDGMWTFTRSHGSWGARLYLCSPDSDKHRRRILFRDYLRAHPERAAEYAALKRRLAVEAKGDWDAYTRGKSEFVEETVRLAGKMGGQKEEGNGE